MNKVIAVLKLTRIEHSAMLVVAVLAGELLAGGIPGWFALIMSLVTPIFVSMGSFAINDYFDVEVDRLNRKKGRPLVSESLKPEQALNIAGICFLIGVVASAFINLPSLIIAIAFAIAAILYSYKAKRIFLLGNAYVALAMVIPFIFGNYVVSGVLSPAMLPVSVMVFLSGFGREIHGTVRDYSGDVKARDAKTMPKVMGITASAIVALAAYLVAILVSGYMFLYVAPFRSNLIYGVIILVSDALLLAVSLGHLSYKSEAFYDIARDISLVAMALAIFAIFLAPLAHA